MRRPIIAIDFDGTIVEHQFPEIGKLRKGARDAIKEIATWADVIIWTCRYKPYDLEQMTDFLGFYRIPFNAINKNMPTIDFCPVPKIYYDVLIDDRNLGGVPPWDEITRQLDRFRQGWKP